MVIPKKKIKIFYLKFWTVSHSTKTTKEKQRQSMRYIDG